MDYKYSHIAYGKGMTYDKTFTTSKTRSLLWELERLYLSYAVESHCVANEKYLDFACGTGRIINVLHHKFKKSVGIDVSQEMLRVAVSKNPELQFFCGDILDGNFDSCSYDLITAFRFFANADNELRLKAMSKISTLLKPDGTFIFNNHKNNKSIVYTVEKMFRKKSRTLSHSEVVELVKFAGLKIVEIGYVGRFPYNERFDFLPGFLIRSIEYALQKINFSKFRSSVLIYILKKE